MVGLLQEFAQMRDANGNRRQAEEPIRRSDRNDNEDPRRPAKRQRARSTHPEPTPTKQIWVSDFAILCILAAAAFVVLIQTPPDEAL